MEKNYIDIIRNEINKASSSLSESELKDTNDFLNRLESNNEILKNVYESLKLVFDEKTNTKETDEIIIFEKYENNKEKLKKLVDIFSFTKSIPDFSETDAKLICKLMCADPNVDGFSFNKDHFVRKDLESHVEINMVVSEVLELCLQNAKDILSDCRENNPEYNEVKKDFERIKQMSDSYYTGPIYPLTLYENTDLKSQIESGSSLKNDNKWLGNFKVSDGLSFEIVTGNYEGNSIIDLRPCINTYFNNLHDIRGMGTYKGESLNVEVVDDDPIVNLDSHWISYKLGDLLDLTSDEIQTKFIKDVNNKINNSIILKECSVSRNTNEIIKVEIEAGNICSKLLSEDFSGNMLKKVQSSIEKLTEKSFDEVCNDLGITEENGYKMLEILIKAKDYFNNNFYSKRPTAEQIAVGLEDGWNYDVALKGYSDSSNDDIDLRLSTIERIDVMEVFDSNFEAAEQAEKDGIKLIPENELNFNKYKGDLYSLHRYIDNEENRTVLKELGFIREIKPYHVEYYLDGGFVGKTESFSTVEVAVLHINDKKDLKYDFWKVTDEYDHDWAYKTEKGIEIKRTDGSTYLYNKWDTVESHYPDYYKSEMITLSNDIASWDEGNNEDFKTVQDFERRYQLGLKTREDILEYGERLDKLLYKTACAYSYNLYGKEDLLWACEHTNFNEVDLVPNSIQLKVESNDYDFLRTKALLPEDIVKQLHLNPGFKYNILADITKENKLQNFVIQSDTWKNEPVEDDIGISVETFTLETGINFEELILEEMDSITQQSFELTFNPKIALYHSQSEYGGEGGDYEFDGKIDSKTLMSFDSRLDSLVPAPGDEKNDFYGVLFSDDKGSTFVELHSLKDDKILYPEALGSDGNEPVYANFELSAEAKEKLINNITRYKIEQKLDFSHFTEENFKVLQKEIIDSKDSPDIIDKELGSVIIGDIEIPLEFEKTDVSTESEVWLNLEAYYPDENGYRDLDGMGYSREEKYGEMPAIGIRNSSSNTGAIFENCSYEVFKTIISKYVSEAIINDHLESRALEKENISLKDSAIKYNNEMITINAYDATDENIERVKYFLSNIINKDISSETAKAFINNLGVRDYGNDEIEIPLDKSNSDKLSISRDCKTWVYDNFSFIKKEDRKLRQVKSADLSFLIDEVYYFAESRVGNTDESYKDFELLKELKSTYDSIKEPLTVDYAFPEYNFDKNMMEITVYEEPRWQFSDINVALNIIKENAPSLFDEIQVYINKFTTDRFVYIDFGKSLRYDEEYSKESLEDKLDDRFIVRYSSCGDDGNLDDGGEEIVIEDKELVKKLNSMIEEHVQQNIENYKSFSESGPKVNFVFVDPEDIVLDDDSIQMRVFNDADFKLEKLLDPDFDLVNDALSFYYTKNIKTGWETIHWVNYVSSPNREGYIDADTIDTDISVELVNKIYENIRNVFQKEFDSYSNDRIISEGLKENILKENKNAFLINSLISENAYNKALEDIKAQAADDFSKDFNIAINFGNNELVKELAPAANNILSDGVLSDCLYNAICNYNKEAWKAILDTENSPGQIIGQNWVLLCDAAADLNEDIISDILNRYENNKEILSSLIFETNDSGKNALQVALERWKNDEYYDNDMPDMIPPAIKLLGEIEERVTESDKISLYKDKQTGNYMTVNSLINSYEINIFNSKGELLEHDTFDSYNTPDGKSNDVTSHLEAALVTMNDWGNWHNLEIMTGPNAVSLSQELYDSVSKSLQDFEASGFDNLIAYNQHKTDIELLKLLDKKDYEQINAWKKEYNIDDDNSILSELSFAKLKSIYSEKLNKHLSDSITKSNATIRAEFTNEIAPNTIVNLEPYYKTSPLIEKVPEDSIEYFISSSVFENRIEDIYNEFNLINDTSWVMAVKKEKVKSFDNEEDVILAHLTIPDEAYIFKDVANNRMTLNDNDSLELYFTCDKRNIIKNLTLRVMSKTGETKYISLEKENNLFHGSQLVFGLIGSDFLDALKANCSDVLSNYIYEKKGLSKEEAFFVYPKPGYVVDYSNNESMDEFTEVLNNNLIYSEEPGLTVEQGRLLQKYMQKAGYQLYIDDDKGNLYYYNTDNIFNSSKDTSTAQLVLTVKDLLLNAKENKENYYKTDDERILAPLIKFYETKFVELGKNSEETIKKEQSKRTVTNRYLDSVKKLLDSEHPSVEPLEDILSAAQKALNNFTAEEKKEISDFLLSKGAKDSSSMGNIIKKSINNKDKEHKKERNEPDIHER